MCAVKGVCVRDFLRKILRISRLNGFLIANSMTSQTVRIIYEKMKLLCENSSFCYVASNRMKKLSTFYFQKLNFQFSIFEKILMFLKYISI